MKKIILTLFAMLLVLGADAQSKKYERSGIIEMGYQTDYKRVGIGLQGRYVLVDKFRIAPEVVFYVPNDKVTGLDFNLNFHYVINFHIGKHLVSVYPLAGFGMQNNFYGKRNMHNGNETVTVDSKETSDLALNIGSGMSIPIGKKSFINTETRFMFADSNSIVMFVGYGYKF